MHVNGDSFTSSVSRSSSTPRHQRRPVWTRLVTSTFRPDAFSAFTVRSLNWNTDDNGKHCEM